MSVYVRSENGRGVIGGLELLNTARANRAFAIVVLTVLAWTDALASPSLGSCLKDSLKLLDLRGSHEALLDTFIASEALQGDPELAKAFAEVRTGAWKKFSANADLRKAFEVLNRLELLPIKLLLKHPIEAFKVKKFLNRAGQSSFDQLSANERSELFSLMLSSGDNDLRKMAKLLRMTYVREVFSGSLGAKLSDVALKPLAVPNLSQFITEYTPKLPPTRLRYDSVGRKIAHVDGPIDYLIVGSGPGGAITAKKLQEAGYKVLLVDRGSLAVPGAINTPELPAFFENGGIRFTDDGAILVRNGEAAGGGSTVNVDLAFSPLHPSIQARLKQWVDEGRITPGQYSLSNLQRAYSDVVRRIGTRRVTSEEINPNNAILWEGAKASGYDPKLYDLNAYPANQAPSPILFKKSAVEGLILPGMTDEKNPLSMLPDVHVKRVLFENEGLNQVVKGIEIEVANTATLPGLITDPHGLKLPMDTKITIHARNVVISAGSLGSPSLLLRSGVKNPNIGKGVILHPSIPLLGLFDHTIDADKGIEATVFLDNHAVSHGIMYESMSAGPEYIAAMFPGDAKETLELVRGYRTEGGFGVMLIDTSNTKNRVTLDAAGNPSIVYSLSEKDKTRFRFGVAEAVRMMFRGGAKRVILPTTENVLGIKNFVAGKNVVLTSIEQADLIEKNLRFVPNRTMISSAHIQATNKMGTDPHTSVVGPDQHVWGTQGLYVADGSVFPGSIGANPMQSIYAFSSLFAEGIIQRARGR